jgi:hypothetical protein
MKREEFKKVTSEQSKKLVDLVNEINENSDTRVGYGLYMVNRGEESSSATLALHAIHGQDISRMISELVGAIAENEGLSFEAALAHVTIEALENKKQEA